MRTALLVALCIVGEMTTALAATNTQTFSTSSGDVKITPLYHASTLIEAGGKTIYLDPAKPARLSGLPKADLILITDIHPDHMDPESIAAISKPDTQIISSHAVAQTVNAAKPSVSRWQWKAALSHIMSGATADDTSCQETATNACENYARH